MRLNQDQKLIKNLLGEDQKDRSSTIFKKYHDQKRLGLISKRDRRRIDAVSKILLKNPKLGGVDYFRAGLLFQHGQSLELIKRAQGLASRSMNLGYEPGRWLYAATTDRMLMMVGKKLIDYTVDLLPPKLVRRVVFGLGYRGVEVKRWAE